jgi:1,4-alpha-glucan branching enzyme
MLEQIPHRGIKRLIDDLNGLYRNEKALHQTDRQQEGFEWVETGENIPSLFAFLRKAEDPSNQLLVILNFSEKAVENFHPPVFDGMEYDLIFNSDSKYYGGLNEGGLSRRGAAQYVQIKEFSGLILRL